MKRGDLFRVLLGPRKRGPDAEGLWISDDGHMGLAHRRLAIIDLDPRANQPMAGEDGTLVIRPRARRHRRLSDEATIGLIPVGGPMKDRKLLERITINPKVMVGKPVIRGTRLTVEYVLNLLAHGATTEEIIKEYRGLTRKDIQACILFATKSLEDSAFMPLTDEAA